MSQALKQALYCDLDALLDTRIGTVYKLNPEAAQEILQKEEYFFRTHDHQIPELSDKITTEEFIKAYAERDVETLMVSRPTNMLLSLTAMLMKLRANAINTPLINEVHLEVNLWPYQLTREEMEEFKIVISTYAGAETRITVINQVPTEIKPAFIKEHYGAVIFYDFQEWCKVAFPLLQTTVRIPDVSVMAPALYEDINNLPKPEDEKFDDDKHINAFAATELLFSEYMHLAFQPVVGFCHYSTEMFRKFKPPSAAEQMRDGEDDDKTAQSEG